MLTLNIQKRDMKASLEKIREEGFIPAVFYGRKEKSTPISVTQKDFIKVWKKAGESSVISLKDGSEEHEALIQDVDVDPVKGFPRHADFYVIEKGQKLKVKVPIEFTGTSPAVKELGGILVKVLQTLEVEATPKDLPHAITIDISVLAQLDSQILAKTIVLPAGVILIAKPDEVIASIAVPKEEKEEESAPIDLDSIEVEKKGKKPEEGGAEGEAGAPAGEAKATPKK